MKIFMLMGLLISASAWSFERSAHESIPDHGLKEAGQKIRVPSSERPLVIKTDEVKIKVDKATHEYEEE